MLIRSRLSSLREVAIVLFKRDCSQHIPSRGTAHANRERLCPVVADADLSGANSSPQGPLHPTHRADWLSQRFGSATASTVFLELAQAGGISSCVGQLGSNNHRRILDYVVSFLCVDFIFFLLRRIFLAGSARPELMWPPWSDTPDMSFVWSTCAR